jgi:hypothetical protein
MCFDDIGDIAPIIKAKMKRSSFHELQPTNPKGKI